jgi:hypothetical protein
MSSEDCRSHLARMLYRNQSSFCILFWFLNFRNLVAWLITGPWRVTMGLRIFMNVYFNFSSIVAFYMLVYGKWKSHNEFLAGRISLSKFIIHLAPLPWLGRRNVPVHKIINFVNGICTVCCRATFSSKVVSCSSLLSLKLKGWYLPCARKSNSSR